MEEIRYSRNCEEISIYSFNKISETGDYRHLVRDWDEYSEVEIDQVKCEDLWKDIYNEYCTLSDDNKIIMFYDIYNDLTKLRAKKELMEQLLVLFAGIDDKDIFEKYNKVFTELGYPVEWEKGVEAEYLRLKQRLKFFENKINVKQAEMDALNEGSAQGNSIPFLEQVVMIESHRKNGAIDIRKTSAAKWIYIIKNISKNVK